MDEDPSVHIKRRKKKVQQKLVTGISGRKNWKYSWSPGLTRTPLVLVFMDILGNLLMMDTNMFYKKVGSTSMFPSHSLFLCGTSRLAYSLGSSDVG